MLIIVVRVVLFFSLNRVMVIVIVSLKKLFVFMKEVGVVILCGSF